MKRIFALAAMLAIPASMSLAAINTDELVKSYQDQKYTTIEVTVGLNQTKVEAIRNNEKIEVVYDNETGNVLETELGTPDADDDITPGVTVRYDNDDSVNDDDLDDDSKDDDHDDDHGDDHGGDHGGDDKGGDN